MKKQTSIRAQTFALILGLTSFSAGHALPKNRLGKGRSCHLALVASQNSTTQIEFSPEEQEDIRDWILTQSESGTILNDLSFGSGFRQWVDEHALPFKGLNDYERQNLVIQFIGEKLKNLEAAPALRRDASLALELQDLLPKLTHPEVFPLDPNSELWRLSQHNLKSWWERFNNSYPYVATDPEILRLSNKAANQLFMYTVKGLTSPRPKDLLPPYLGIKELRTLQLADETSPYQLQWKKIWPNNNSVTFEFTGGAKSGFFGINVKSTKLKLAYALDTDFVRINGYMVPALQTPMSLLQFFKSWENPNAAENLFQDFLSANKFNLPKTVLSAQQLADFLIQRPFEALDFTPLRKALSGMIFTPEDGENLVRQCFERWLTHLARLEGPEVVKVHLQLGKRGGLQVLYQRFLQEGLGLPQGFHMHIPVSVPGDYLTLLEIEPVAYRPWADLQKKSQSPRDSRRLPPEDN